MAGKRPDWVEVPAHLSENPPVPEPEAPKEQAEHGGKDGLEPTRYGDWERKGICWDF
ncbi:MAG: DUF1674 domain-containing protein [Parasphingopyxis sp.]|uniref:DUF1674 domain-containing protein n=1 Tax=Parasphingopyxis sp. TaxID=1920299 RepID=UPI003F9F4017